MGRYPATELSRLPRFVFAAGAAAARRITYIGVTFRTRSIEEIREIFDEVRKDIWGAVESR